jgi:hypothetical protein
VRIRTGSGTGSLITEQLERSDGGVIELEEPDTSLEMLNKDKSRVMSKSGKKAGSSGRLSWSGLYAGE